MYESLVQKIESLEKTNEQLRNKGYECFVGLINSEEYFQAYTEIGNIPEDKKYAAVGVLKEHIVNKSRSDGLRGILVPETSENLSLLSRLFEEKLLN